MTSQPITFPSSTETRTPLGGAFVCRTLGAFRALTARLPDETPIVIDHDMLIAAAFDDESGALILDRNHDL